VEGTSQEIMFVLSRIWELCWQHVLTPVAAMEGGFDRYMYH